MLTGLGCQNKPTAAPEAPPQSNFFPVTDYLQREWSGLDSLAVTPLHVSTRNGKTDSLWIERGTLKQLLTGFLAPNIGTNNLTEHFIETSFRDETINAITFSYDPRPNLPDSISLRHWDVYIDPDTGKLRQVYLIKQVEDNGRKFQQQLTWKSQAWAKIVVLEEQAGGLTVVQEDKFVWDF